MTRSRPVSGLRRALLAVVLVPVPVIAYVVLWRWLGDSALNRVAYVLWLIHGPDSDAIDLHAGMASAFFAVIVPVVLGGAGIGWWRILERRRR